MPSKAIFSNKVNTLVFIFKNVLEISAKIGTNIYLNNLKIKKI